MPPSPILRTIEYFWSTTCPGLSMTSPQATLILVGLPLSALAQRLGDLGDLRDRSAALLHRNGDGRDDLRPIPLACRFRQDLTDRPNGCFFYRFSPPSARIRTDYRVVNRGSSRMCDINRFRD